MEAPAIRRAAAHREFENARIRPDPAFAPYRELGAANLYLVDLSSGAARRITNMAAGQYALYPHFRADNWINFVVRTTDVQEYFAATDAAVVSD